MAEFAIALRVAVRLVRQMIRTLISLLLLATTVTPGRAGDFQGIAGLQLYSLREQFKTDVPGTLDEVQAWGIKEVETAGTYGLTPEKFRELLEARGLKAVSGHFKYELLAGDIDGVIREAKALGVQYVACAWIPHTPTEFNEEVTRRAAVDFNRAGEALAKAGLKFAYHAHGYEFAPFGDGTYFDLLVKETKPGFVNFEMDVFWITHPGKNPAELLAKYPDRWSLMHLKDIRKGAKTGIFTGKAALPDDVILGTGQVDWPMVLRAAAKAGVKHYFIEDESPTVEAQIPESLKYLQTLK